jgi:hypothetical protein
MTTKGPTDFGIIIFLVAAAAVVSTGVRVLLRLRMSIVLALDAVGMVISKTTARRAKIFIVHLQQE